MGQKRDGLIQLLLALADRRVSLAQLRFELGRINLRKHLPCWDGIILRDQHLFHAAGELGRDIDTFGFKPAIGLAKPAGNSAGLSLIQAA